MSRRTALVIIGVVLVVAVLLAVAVKRGRGPARPGQDRPETASGPTGAPGSATLYFPGQGDRLEAEERAIPADLEGAALARRVLEELLAGPSSDGLLRALPEGTRIDFVEPTEAGVLWVSLAPAEGATPPRYGSRGEILAVYSLVNTLCVNVPGVDRVALLWNGVEPTTFAGHLDTRYPLLPDRRWIRSAS